jgi:hypothetical protein
LNDSIKVSCYHFLIKLIILFKLAPGTKIISSLTQGLMFIQIN